MLRKTRLYLSAMLAALILFSLLTTANVKACEEEPLTFLSLYMSSDLIVIARFDGESEPQKTGEDEYGHTLKSQRKLAFTKIFKGPAALKTVSFAYSEYVPKPNQDASATEESVPEDEHFFDVSKIKIGNEYLFFLTKNKETDAYSVTDYMSGVREIGKNAPFYERNLGELQKIASAKENQSELLTEWIVRSLETAESREDAIRDLAESFYGLTYQDEDPVFKGKGPFVVTEEGYGVYTVGVAKRLTQTQKDRISNALYPLLQEAWFAEQPQYVNYGISAILGGIDKSRLALYSYNSLQNVGKNDTERKRIVTEFLIDAVGDETFSKIYYDIQDLENKIEEAKTFDTPEGKKQTKTLTALRDAKARELDKRFRFLQSRNFAPVEVQEA